MTDKKGEEREPTREEKRKALDKNPRVEVKEEKRDFSLHKFHKEREKPHRAFLLWAMQDVNHRHLTTVARAIGVSHTQISNYRKQFVWDERATRHTDEVEAYQLYKQLYHHKFGEKELDFVKKNMTLAVKTGPENVPRSVAPSIQKAMKDAKIESLKDPKTKHDKEVKKRHIMLLDAAITYIAQGLKEGDIKRQLRDLPILISLRNELLESDNKSAKAQIVYESIRVKDAKENGGDILEAMYEDVQELQVIIGALRNKNINREEIFEKNESS